ncbi:HTR-like protein [Salinarchaeum sp. Harcht-Bsk1]|uniref:histidine kinase N-terminal 7TM domain-containing protein n=1 Tax=Salinarchaeum sp. Harcht-Bsk1 TaxID=1333523 RepID=UPI00034229AB|nr:histidine kinase N-terminal 7TM domain-containing protein [Salinarchaeum sp. Harcht-Bsk1]AGN00625.1 HTR-like protein [Salinarchaeum sp. Harcht-Bsk1]
MPVSPLVVLSLLSGVLCLVSGWLVRGRWAKPGALWFQIGALASACWSIGYGVGLLVFDSRLRQLFEIPIWLGHGVGPVAFFLFVAAYTGRRTILDRPIVAGLFVVPAITMVAVLTSGEHALMWTDYRIDAALGAATVTYEKQPWLYVHKAYSYAVLLAAGAILLAVLVDRDALYTIQATLLMGVVVSLGAGSLAWVIGIGPYPQVTTTPLLFGWVFAIAAAVFFRAPLFDSPPAARRLGRERLLSEFGDGVVVVDDEGRIVEANPAAIALLGSAADDDLVGRSIDEIGGVPADSAESSIPLEQGRHRVELQTASGRQPFEITISPVRDESGSLLGRTLVFQDVSEETRRRQQLSVLNRVLRHNLRNDMTVVRAFAEELADSAPDERRADMAETILEEADGLLSLGEQARTIEESLADPDRPVEPIELEPIVDDVVEPYRDSAEVTVDVPEGYVLETDPRSLAAVLTAAVDNAVEHSSADRPAVTIAANHDAGRARITVSDDGPGIPDHELEPIRAGTETDLEHGSGLGLWLITWGAGSLGGEVSFHTGDDAGPGDGGTTIELELPGTDTSEQSP